MPQESTNTQSRATTPRGYSLSGGQRHTRAMLPTPERSIVSHKLSVSAWHKPYGEALLATDRETLMKLLGATERAVFERLLELVADEDASNERQDIRRAIDVILTLKREGSSRAAASPQE
jgi:hypothetical protein